MELYDYSLYDDLDYVIVYIGDDRFLYIPNDNELCDLVVACMDVVRANGDPTNAVADAMDELYKKSVKVGA